MFLVDLTEHFTGSFSLSLSDLRGRDFLSSSVFGIIYPGLFCPTGVLKFLSSFGILSLGVTKVAIGAVKEVEVKNLFDNPSAASYEFKLLHDMGA